MRGGYAVSVVVLVGLLVAAQLAFTGVGLAINPAWTSPTHLASTQGDRSPDGGIQSLAAAGGGANGTVAWIDHAASDWRVRIARVRSTTDGVTVERVRTVARSRRRLSDVDVAQRGGEIAVVWRRRSPDRIVLARRTPAGWSSAVVSNGSPRVVEPSVGLTAAGPVVAWQAYDNGTFGVRLVQVADGDALRYRWVGRPTGGVDSPSITVDRSEFAVTWVDATGPFAVVTPGTSTPDAVTIGRTNRLGVAHPSGGFGAGSGSLSIASGQSNGTVRAVWTSAGEVETRALDVTAGDAGDHSRRMTLGGGERPTVALRGRRWLAAWLVHSRQSGYDVAFRLSGRTDAAGAGGVLSASSSNANRPRAVFAGRPTVVWVENGGTIDVVASAYRGPTAVGPAKRLTNAPGRFAFVTLAAAVIGLLTSPLLPWSFVALLGAFFLSTRVAVGLFAGFVARLPESIVAAADADEIRRRLYTAPPLAYAGLFALGQTALAVAVLATSPRARSLGFSNALVIGVGAFVAVVAIDRLVDVDSSWRLVALYVYVFNATIWTTALPTVM